MVTRLKLISGYNKFLAIGLFILVCLLIMPGTNVLAQTEIFDQNSVGGGPTFGYSNSDGSNAYQVGISVAKTPDVDLGFTFTKYHLRGSRYMSVAPSITLFPVKIYNDNTRLLLAFHGEYENSLMKVRRGYQKESRIKSYLLGITLIAGGHSDDRSSIFLPYVTYGYINVLSITEKENNIFDYGLIIGRKLGKKETFIALSLGASRYSGDTTFGAKLVFFLEKDYITTNHLE